MSSGLGTTNLGDLGEGPTGWRVTEGRRTRWLRQDGGKVVASASWSSEGSGGRRAGDRGNSQSLLVKHILTKSRRV